MKSLKINLGQIFKLFLCGITIPFLFGCSKELSRVEAEKSIRVKEHFPCDDIRVIDLSSADGQTYNIYHDSPNDQIQQQVYLNYTKPSAKALFVNLQNEGLITYKIEIVEIENRVVWTAPGSLGYIESQSSRMPEYTIKKLLTYFKYVHRGYLTEKGKQYQNGSGFIVAKREFGEITGIVERKELNISEVNFTEKRKDITPFGKALGINEETFNRTETFTKYDDGWRLQ